MFRLLYFTQHGSLVTSGKCTPACTGILSREPVARPCREPQRPRARLTLRAPDDDTVYHGHACGLLSYAKFFLCN